MHSKKVAQVTSNVEPMLLFRALEMTIEEYDRIDESSVE